MKPNGQMEGRLAKLEGFIQRAPKDDAPASQRTEAYLGYDDKNLYIIVLCFDSQPERIRARLSPRDVIRGDDVIEVNLDTFNDQRRAYVMVTNAFGVQWDALFTEGGASQPGTRIGTVTANRTVRGDPQNNDPAGYDRSFDMEWYSKGKLTSQGYIVWLALPFKSVRFPSSQQQTWRIVIGRTIPRANEYSLWPPISSRIEGRLNQAARLEGMENISPGRNNQLIPFGVLRSFRALDTLDPNQPRFVGDRADANAGLDAKVVLKNRLVVDLALNPDFSQVESDEPQVTVNQRFEVFFPEKRPFFLENASFFHTPINLVFTRRIADPQYGIRLTSKLGSYAIGGLLTDDESPGRAVPRSDPVAGRRAFFGIVRVNRDVFKQSTFGLIYTDREFEGSFNRVGGLDGRLKLTKNWVARFQGVASSTKFLDGSRLAGPAYDFQLARSGRQFTYTLEYNDRSPGFRTHSGFLTRPDIRRVGQNASYRFRPEGKRLIAWGPTLNTVAVFDHNGTRLDLTQESALNWELVGQTQIEFFYNWNRERLRPQDFSVLPANRDFSHNRKGFFLSSTYIRPSTFYGEYSWGTLVNFVPPAGQEPALAGLTTVSIGNTLRLFRGVRVDSTYILSRLTDRATRDNIFNNHILRSKWNYQISRPLSLRLILQYNAVLANPVLTSLQTTKNFNADFLLTYLVHPGMVLYIGYNSNLQNLDPALVPTDRGLLRTQNGFINDGRQFFAKFSYLLRF